MNEVFKKFKNAKQLTVDQCKLVAAAHWWEKSGWKVEELACFQLYQEKMCLPFSFFHEGMEKLLGRPVWTHEFARPDLLKAEVEGIKEMPDFTEVMKLLETLTGDDTKVIVLALEDNSEDKDNENG